MAAGLYRRLRGSGCDRAHRAARVEYAVEGVRAMQSPQNGWSGRGLGAGVALLAGCCLVCLGALLWGPPAHAHPVPAPARPATSNRIAQENALPGTDTWGI